MKNKPHRKFGADLSEWLLGNKVITPHGCWEWIAGSRVRNYGQIRVSDRNVLVHRLAFQLWRGEIPPGIHVLHRCDNPACFNPDHLFLGTHRDNMEDMVRKGRSQRKLSDEAVAEIRNSGLPSMLLAGKHKVCVQTVNRIKSGKFHKPIPLSES
jgi:hypothetical protein